MSSNYRKHETRFFRYHSSFPPSSTHRFSILIMQRLFLFALLPHYAVAVDCTYQDGGTNLDNAESNCNCPRFANDASNGYCLCQVCQAGTSALPNGVCHKPTVPYPAANAYTGVWTQKRWAIEDCAGSATYTFMAGAGCTSWWNSTTDQLQWAKGSCDPATGYSVFHIFDNDNCAGTPTSKKGVNQHTWPNTCVAVATTIVVNNTLCTSGNGMSLKTTCTLPSSGTSPTPGSSSSPTPGSSSSPAPGPANTGVSPSPPSSNVQGGSSSLYITAIHVGLVAMGVFHTLY